MIGNIVWANGQCYRGIVIGKTMDEKYYVVYNISKEIDENSIDKTIPIRYEEIDIRFRGNFINNDRIILVKKHNVTVIKDERWAFKQSTHEKKLIPGDYVSFVEWEYSDSVSGNIPVPTTGMVIQQDGLDKYTIKILSGTHGWGAKGDDSFGFLNIYSQDVVYMGNFISFSRVLDNHYPKEDKIGRIVYDTYKQQYGIVLAEPHDNYSALVAFPLPEGRFLFKRERESIQDDKLLKFFDNLPCFYWTLQEDLIWIDSSSYMEKICTNKINLLKKSLEGELVPPTINFDECMKQVGEIAKAEMHSENSTQEEELKLTELTVKEKEEIDKVYQNKPYTIVILKSGVKGITKCLDGDVYDFNTGLYIAYCRAKMEEYRMKIRKLD